MNVVVDTDVFIRDPWFEGQEVRVLLNFLKRTHSKVLLLDTVDSELQERMRREFAKTAEEVTTALRHGQHKRLHFLPAFDSHASVEATLNEWQTNFNQVFSANELERIPLDNSVLREATRRATKRIPPCKKNGEGMRDAIVWLNFLSYVRSIPHGAEVAFITSNSEDYADADKESLKPELREDLRELRSSVLFFVHLAAFNKAHSNHIQHITPTWVVEKGIVRSIEGALNRFFRFKELREYFRVSSMDYDDYYEPESLETIHTMEIEIGDVTVWNFTEGHSELKIDFTVDIEADAVCLLTDRPSVFWDRHYRDDLEDEYPAEKSLTCYGQLSGSIAAVSQNGELIAGNMEELERR